MFHSKQWLVLLPQYLRALDFTGFYIFFSQHLDSFFCNSAIRNWIKSKNETNHLDARDKMQSAINPTWKICTLHPWWSLSLWRRPRIHFRALGDKTVRFANTPLSSRWHQLTNPTDIQHSKWLHSCQPQVTVPEALSSPEDSGRPPSITRDIGRQCPGETSLNDPEILPSYKERRLQWPTETPYHQNIRETPPPSMTREDSASQNQGRSSLPSNLKK